MLVREHDHDQIYPANIISFYADYVNNKEKVNKLWTRNGRPSTDMLVHLNRTTDSELNLEGQNMNYFGRIFVYHESRLFYFHSKYSLPV